MCLVRRYTKALYGRKGRHQWMAVWRRITELYSKNLEVFHNIDPNDILQGSLGDCYLLSSISALAEKPERVKKLFYTQNVSPDGKYKIGLYHEGLWTLYEIDDYFPCIGNNIAFSGPRFEDNVIELWVILLEKAWAKKHKGYFNIEDGYAEDALRDLTGAPCETIRTSAEDIWKVLKESNEKNYIVTGSIENQQEINNQIGLVTLHSYSIIEIQEYLTEKLLLIRNPWGRHEFKGDWSDGSNKWTPDAKRKLKWEDKDDGCFWMGLADFTRYFNNITICRVEDTYQYTNSSSTNNSCFKVCLYTKGLTYFNVTQKSKTPLRIIVASSNGYIRGKSGINENLWIGIDCEPGDYFIYTEKNNEYPITFSIYSEKNARIEEIIDTGLLQNMVNDNIKKLNPDVIEIEQGIYVHRLEMIGAHQREFKEGFIYDLIENSKENESALIEISLENSFNISMIGPSSFILNPGDRIPIIFKHSDLLENYKIQVIVKTKLIPFIYKNN